VVQRGRWSVRKQGKILFLLVLLLPDFGCGARWNARQRASVKARYAASASGAPAASTSDQAQTPAEGSVAGPAATVGEPSGARSINTPSASQSVNPGGSTLRAAQGGAAPCAAPSDAPGVSPSEIRVGSISSLSGPVPGLGSSSAAAARAYVAYRNSTGGVCGRRIVLREADDGTDNGRYRSIVNELGPQVLGLAGGFAFGDVGGADLVRQQALPIMGAPSGEVAAAPPTVFDVNPNLEPIAGVAKYRWLHDQGAKTVAIAYIAVDQSRYEANLQRRLMEAAGIKVVLQKELPLSTLSYDSAARAVANSHADYMWFVADVNGEASMARSVADTGYKLRFAEYFTFAYATPFTKLAGEAAEGTLAFLRSLPNEEASTNAELRRFLEWMDRVAQGEALDPFAVDSWVGVKAFFDSVQALHGPITRKSLVEQLAATQLYDADGMYGQIRLGAKRNRGCVVAIRFEKGVWRRLAPERGFLC
jgi:ABC-type branched-subunit amino acid transport system substrate-binding protein